MFTRKRAAIVATIAAAAITLAGCSGSDSEETTAPTTGAATSDGAMAAPEGTLTLGTLVPVTTFEAANAAWANESPYMQAVYDTILRADPDGTIVAGLATDWSWDDTNTVLTMTLRDDVVFTDGNPVDADAAAQSILRFQGGTSPQASSLRFVEDATAVDAQTLQITLSAPDPALTTMLTQNAGMVESPAAFDSADIATNPVGSGPYTFNAEESVVGDSYVFDVKADYWKPEDQYYEKIVMKVFSDATAMLNAIQSGQINGAKLADNTTIPQIEGAGWDIVSGELNWAGLLLTDRDGALTPALGDVRVRQAINYALDRDGLLQAAAAGYGTVTEQIFPTFSTSFDESLDATYTYDVEKAKQLMADAGYADGFDLTIPYTPAFGATIFPIVEQQLGEIGITVELDEIAVTDYISGILGQKYSAAFMQLQQDPSDWQIAQFQIVAAAAWNPFNIEDPKVEELAGVLQTGTPEEAEAAGKELNAYLVDQAWNAPLYRNQSTFVTDANTDAQFQVVNAYPYLWTIKPTN